MCLLLKTFHAHLTRHVDGAIENLARLGRPVDPVEGGAVRHEHPRRHRATWGRVGQLERLAQEVHSATCRLEGGPPTQRLRQPEPRTVLTADGDLSVGLAEGVVAVPEQLVGVARHQVRLELHLDRRDRSLDIGGEPL